MIIIVFTTAQVFENSSTVVKTQKSPAPSTWMTEKTFHDFHLLIVFSILFYKKIHFECFLSIEFYLLYFIVQIRIEECPLSDFFSI